MASIFRVQSLCKRSSDGSGFPFLCCRNSENPRFTFLQGCRRVRVWNFRIMSVFFDGCVFRVVRLLYIVLIRFDRMDLNFLFVGIECVNVDYLKPSI